MAVLKISLVNGRNVMSAAPQLVGTESVCICHAAVLLQRL